MILYMIAYILENNLVTGYRFLNPDTQEVKDINTESVIKAVQSNPGAFANLAITSGKLTGTCGDIVNYPAIHADKTPYALSPIIALFQLRIGSQLVGYNICNYNGQVISLNAQDTIAIILQKGAANIKLSIGKSGAVGIVPLGNAVPVIKVKSIPTARNFKVIAHDNPVEQAQVGVKGGDKKVGAQAPPKAPVKAPAKAPATINGQAPAPIIKPSYIPIERPAPTETPLVPQEPPETLDPSEIIEGDYGYVLGKELSIDTSGTKHWIPNNLNGYGVRYAGQSKAAKAPKEMLNGLPICTLKNTYYGATGISIDFRTFDFSQINDLEKLFNGTHKCWAFFGQDADIGQFSNDATIFDGSDTTIVTGMSLSICQALSNSKIHTVVFKKCSLEDYIKQIHESKPSSRGLAGVVCAGE